MIEVDEGNTAVIACNLPESHPKAQVRYSVKQEWLEASRGECPGVCPSRFRHRTLVSPFLTSSSCLYLLPLCPFATCLSTSYFRVPGMVSLMSMLPGTSWFFLSPLPTFSSGHCMSSRRLGRSISCDHVPLSLFSLQTIILLCHLETFRSLMPARRMRGLTNVLPTTL